MLLHIGGDCGVPLKSIVAIISLEGEPTPATADFIAVAREEGFVSEVCPPPHKSAVLTADRKGYRLYLSPITAGTLSLRAGMNPGTAAMLP